ncbi:uncharacterized protein LOC106635734 [Copidosoma floridanum]|uniref:uncharacterized protein LOC106635734 n=1 Tax=Copidosoma floridanum TaxID=29053 RepID=UPI0006C9DA22|nr:uncharacterized protein LOC106635734 [Copidosoma floridanum]XP_014203344.1 uncharacterized protein LOC106635734 [Copidosoma floridanum]
MKSEDGATEMGDAEIGMMVRRASLDSVDRVSLASSTTSTSSVMSGELGSRTLRSLKRGLGKLWRRHRGNASITEYDPTYKVAYLGNVLTGWAKGEGCVEKPVSTLWRNYTSSNRPDVTMRLTVTNGGLTATTKDHGLTEYWAHRVTYCTAPASHPRLFVWVYRHEGRRLRPELRCHAALCSKESTARRLASVLDARLHQALLEFRRDKVSKQNARLSLANSVYENPSLPRRKILLSTGGSNYRPPLERSKSAPKLSAIEEDAVAEEMEQQRFLEELRSLQHCGWQEPDSWRLARLLDALNSRESSDENGSISSGCETASTANSEERASSGEDSHAVLMTHEADSRNGEEKANGTGTTEPTAPSTSPGSSTKGIGPRRNSEGSPHFMTCAGSPRFRRRSARPQRRSRAQATGEPDESMEDEEEEDEPEPTTPGDSFFVFEDADDMDEVVDFRPHGEGTRLQSDGYSALMARREDVRKLVSARWACSKSRDEGDGCEEEPPTKATSSTAVVVVVTGEARSPPVRASFHGKLGALDEEEADSDESGYVEASPKSSMDRTGMKGRKQEDAGEEGVGGARGGAECTAEFIKCPISETIRKLANASLRSSKGTRACLESLGRQVVGPEIDSAESPSLLQRKRLLAQQGVTV